LITYSKENIPANGYWYDYQKREITRATRVEAQFAVQTKTGRLVCSGGYLCIDPRGEPYPVAEEEFELLYVKADEQEQ